MYVIYTIIMFNGAFMHYVKKPRRMPKMRVLGSCLVVDNYDGIELRRTFACFAVGDGSSKVSVVSVLA